MPPYSLSPPSLKGNYIVFTIHWPFVTAEHKLAPVRLIVPQHMGQGVEEEEGQRKKMRGGMKEMSWARVQSFKSWGQRCCAQGRKRMKRKETVGSWKLDTWVGKDTNLMFGNVLEGAGMVAQRILSVSSLFIMEPLRNIWTEGFLDIFTMNNVRLLWCC